MDDRSKDRPTDPKVVVVFIACLLCVGSLAVAVVLTVMYWIREWLA